MPHRLHLFGVILKRTLPLGKWRPGTRVDVRAAVAVETLGEYRLAALDLSFSGWLQAGAPSAEAEA
jgi:hypothetical protein